MTDRENRDKQFHIETEPDVLNKDVSFLNWLLCLYVYHRLLNIELLCTQQLSSVGVRQPLIESTVAVSPLDTPLMRAQFKTLPLYDTCLFKN